jgi:ATP-dependent RNA helicase HelY
MTARAFLDEQPLTPDRFQLEAAAAIDRGEPIVVTAPTGSGKTLIAESAIARAMDLGVRAFYTTPIKALSNQKFGDLRRVHGPERVGLLTGDNSINGDAPIVVMTTEVLRNMIYADSSALDDLGVVILDEVHYLQDRYRGSVWEEVIIHLPQRVQLVSLSATIANPVEFTGWVESRRGPTTLVVERERPVPLESTYLLSDRYHDYALARLAIFDRRGRPNQQLIRLLRKGRGRRPRFATPRRIEVAGHLQAEGLLPAIHFIFSRAGCDAAARAVAAAGLDLTTEAEQAKIREAAEARTLHLSPIDLAVLGYGEWVATLERGVAAHHAGMVPAFKETVEELFAQGLVQLVFATETLALGINMPAKAVVLEEFSKFTGEGHELLRAGDYTQLTGRAGRRGIDERGTAVVLYSRYVPIDTVIEVAAAGSHPLESSFDPSYNMAVNLVGNYERERAEELLQASFAQYLAEEGRRSLERRVEERTRELEQYAAAGAAGHPEVEARMRRAEHDLRRLRRRLQRRRDDLIERFHARIAVLEELGYLDGWTLTPRGSRLRGVYNEKDLLVVEAIERGLLDDLTPAEFAAVASTLTYEPRREDDGQARMAGTVSDRVAAIDAVSHELAAAEVAAGLEASGSPEGGFAGLAYAWASGATLDELFGEDDFAAGDFVRNGRQLLDLMRQLRDGFPRLARVTTDAIAAVDRGVVATGGIW